jgi:hypothetical protein
MIELYHPIILETKVSKGFIIYLESLHTQF